MNTEELSDLLRELEFAAAGELLRYQREVMGCSMHEKVYHYTSASTLLAILTNNSLRATDFTYCNDAREVVHGKEVVTDVIKAAISTSGDDLTRRLYEGALGIFSERLLHIYGICFSRGGDKLSQWRGYADNGYGYAIGIQPLALAPEQVSLEGRNSTADALIGIPGYVIYQRDQQEAVSRLVLATLVGGIVKSVTSTDIQANFGDLVDMIARAAEVLVPFFKDAGFKEEEEFRYTIQLPDADAVSHPGGFFTRSGLLVPFVTLKPSSGKLQIEEIITGPCTNFEKAHYSLERAREKFGYSSFAIVKSAIPFLP